jgi:phage head maturation protease
MENSRNIAAKNVVLGKATAEDLELLGPIAVAELKANSSTTQVRASSSKRVSLNEKTRSITYIVSDETPDRMGDIISVRGWQTDLYKRNPVILWGHDQSIPPIGRANNVRRRYAGNPRLTADIEFAPAEAHEFADTIYQLAARDFIRATSVGFLPKEVKELADPERKKLGLGKYGQFYSAAELMEVSVVGVPANPSALEAGIKSMLTVGGLTERSAPRFLETYAPESEVSLKSISDLCRTYIDMGALTQNTKDSKVDETQTEEVVTEAEEKSPACRQEGETTPECVERKIPELIEEGMDQDQAVAVANSVCETACNEKQAEEVSMVKAMSQLLQQQAEQTKATRLLVDAVADLTAKVYEDLDNGKERGACAHDAVSPDVVKDASDDLANQAKSAIRGFADSFTLRRDSLSNDTQNGTTNV